jgi:hypothetical protein
MIVMEDYPDECANSIACINEYHYADKTTHQCKGRRTEKRLPSPVVL